MEEKIIELIEPTINDLDLNLVKLSFQGGKQKKLEIFVERKDENKVQIQDCKNVSINISAILDVENIIQDKYFLEVSSAGAERPLTKLEDFKRFLGREIKLKLKEDHNGKFSFKGTLMEMQGDKIIVQSENAQLTFAYENIKEAKLVLSDKMFRELLKNTKRK